MPEILSAIDFDSAQNALIAAKLEDETFSYLNWNDEVLQTLRSAIRNFYRHQQKAICSYCQQPVSLQSASNCHVEHIVPKSKYRKFIFEPKNLCVICADCNEIKREQETLKEVIDPLKKGDNRIKYPKTSGAFKIIHPHFDNYKDHIIILNQMFYIDKSSKGNFTIYSCRLNRRIYAFGWERDLVDDKDLTDLMTRYLNETSTIKRQDILKQLKELLVQT